LSPPRWYSPSVAIRAGTITFPIHRWERGNQRTTGELLGCENVKEKIVVLDRAQVCTMRGNFQVHPNAGVFGGRNKDLRTLSVVIDSLARGGAPVSRSATLEWN